jgi:thiamine-monophosphate kinase
VNLSDIAAMGASPSWALLSLNLASIDEDWLREFAQGFSTLARRHGVCLVGGNLSRGALSITVELAGLVAAGQALRRDGARAGDELYVSGTLGDAAQGCALLREGRMAAEEDARYLRQRFEYPTPRVALGQALRGIASACIDLSDGLSTDLGRLLDASGCGAELSIESLPLSEPLRRSLADEAWRLALSGGEDYELCFTAAPERAQRVRELAGRIGQPLTRIGVLVTSPGLSLKSGNTTIPLSIHGFDHFGNSAPGVV